MEKFNYKCQNKMIKKFSKEINGKKVGTRIE